MRRVNVFFCAISILLSLPIISYAEDNTGYGIGNVESYANQLEAEGKIRVIVRFKDEIKPEVVEKYGKIIRRLDIINGIVCEINKEDLTPLSNEPDVSEAFEDGIMRLDSPANKRMHSLSDIRRQHAIRRYLAAMRKKYLDEILVPAIRAYEKRKIKRGQLLAALGEYREKIEALKGEIIILQSYPDPWTDWNLQEEGIAATTSWSTYPNLDGTGIKIAILDTGVNYTLPDLDAPQYLGGYDFINNDDYPLDDNIPYGHGTPVASIALAQGELKIKGCAYNASYYSVKVLDQNGDGYTSDIFAGIQWATDPAHKADIISMSFGTYGGGPSWPNELAALEDACNTAYNAGIILVASSGNDGYDYCWYPAALENVISVGAHAQDQTIASFSNGNVDIVAPGKRVWAMDRFGEVDEGGLRWYYNGTSFATPHVAGIAALLLQYARENNIKINNGYQWELLKHSAINLGFNELWQGKGKVRAKESIDLAAASWPFTYDIDYLNPVYIDAQGYPAYYIGTTMYYNVILTNDTLIDGNYPDDLENLKVTTTQAYYIDHGEINLPGTPVQVFPTEPLLRAGNQLTLNDSYYLPWSMYPGLDRTILDLEFELASDATNRLIKVTYPYAGIWCPPPAINEGFPVAE